MAKKQTLDTTVNRYYAVHFNQKIWELLSKDSISDEEALELIDIAHASNHHWRFAGGAINQQRGAYMLARAYLAAGKNNEALNYAKRCGELTKAKPEGIEDFDIAYSEEILWKCELLNGNLEKAEQHKIEARRLGDLIKADGDKKYFDKDFETNYKKLIK